MEENKKVEHGGGEPREFSAIRGKGKESHGPKIQNYAEKPAVAKWPPKGAK